MTGWIRARWDTLATWPLAAVLVASTFAVVAWADKPTTQIRGADQTRARYILHTPHGLTTPAPLVVVLPASGWSAGQYRALTRFDGTADRRRLNVAYVDPQGGRWNAGACCAHGTHRDDLAALRWVVADVRRRVPVDPRRVWVVGGSGGGMMAWTAVCWAPDTFTAAGVVAGSLVTSSCPASVDVVRVHGLRDAVVPYRGGRGFEQVVFPGPRQIRGMLRPGSRLVERVKPWTGHRWESGDADLVVRQLGRFAA